VARRPHGLRHVRISAPVGRSGPAPRRGAPATCRAVCGAAGCVRQRVRRSGWGDLPGLPPWPVRREPYLDLPSTRSTWNTLPDVAAVPPSGPESNHGKFTLTPQPAIVNSLTKNLIHRINLRDAGSETLFFPPSCTERYATGRNQP